MFGREPQYLWSGGLANWLGLNGNNDTNNRIIAEQQARLAQENAALDASRPANGSYLNYQAPSNATPGFEQRHAEFLKGAQDIRTDLATRETNYQQNYLGNPQQRAWATGFTSPAGPTAPVTAMAAPQIGTQQNGRSFGIGLAPQQPQSAMDAWNAAQQRKMQTGYYAHGGVVGMHPGQPKGTDTVPAWLTPGEAVLNKGAVQMMGKDQIEQMNKQGLGLMPQQKASNKAMMGNYHDGSSQQAQYHWDGEAAIKEGLQEWEEQKRLNDIAKQSQVQQSRVKAVEAADMQRTSSDEFKDNAARQQAFDRIQAQQNAAKQADIEKAYQQKETKIDPTRQIVPRTGYTRPAETPTLERIAAGKQWVQQNDAQLAAAREASATGRLGSVLDLNLPKPQGHGLIVPAETNGSIQGKPVERVQQVFGQTRVTPASTSPTNVSGVDYTQPIQPAKPPIGSGLNPIRVMDSALPNAQTFAAEVRAATGPKPVVGDYATMPPEVVPTSPPPRETIDITEAKAEQAKRIAAEKQGFGLGQKPATPSADPHVVDYEPVNTPKRTFETNPAGETVETTNAAPKAKPEVASETTTPRAQTMKEALNAERDAAAQAHRNKLLNPKMPGAVKTGVGLGMGMLAEYVKPYVVGAIDKVAPGYQDMVNKADADYAAMTDPTARVPERLKIDNAKGVGMFSAVSKPASSNPEVQNDRDVIAATRNVYGSGPKDSPVRWDSMTPQQQQIARGMLDDINAGKAQKPLDTKAVENYFTGNFSDTEKVGGAKGAELDYANKLRAARGLSSISDPADAVESEAPAASKPAAAAPVRVVSTDNGYGLSIPGVGSMSATPNRAHDPNREFRYDEQGRPHEGQMSQEQADAYNRGAASGMEQVRQHINDGTIRIPTTDAEKKAFAAEEQARAEAHTKLLDRNLGFYPGGMMDRGQYSKDKMEGELIYNAMHGDKGALAILAALKGKGDSDKVSFQQVGTGQLHGKNGSQEFKAPVAFNPDGSVANAGIWSRGLFNQRNASALEQAAPEFFNWGMWSDKGDPLNNKGPIDRFFNGANDSEQQSWAHRKAARQTINEAKAAGIPMNALPPDMLEAAGLTKEELAAYQ